MDEFITILIIIGAIISFLSKIFRQQKKTETEPTAPPVARPKPEEWQPPWFEETEPEKEFSLFEQVETAEMDIRPEPIKEPMVEAKTKKFAPVLSDTKPEPQTDVELEAVTKTSEFHISLKSPNDIRQGIVLAEILGPCKANKKRLTH